MFRVIVAGSRNFFDQDFVNKKLDKILAPYLPVDGFSKRNSKKMVLLSGGAIGTDRLGEMWALVRGVSYLVYLPDEYESMFRLAHAAVIFTTTTSDDTFRIINKAKAYRLKIRVIACPE